MCVCAQSLGHVQFCHPTDCTLPGSSVGFPRQEYWRGLQFPPPEDLPDPAIKSIFPALTGRFWDTWEANKYIYERGEWKSWLKIQPLKNWDHGIHSQHLMANRWGKSGNSDRFYFPGLKNHSRCDCSNEIKAHLLLERKAMTNLDHTGQSRDVTLPKKVCIVKAVAFPVVIGSTDAEARALILWPLYYMKSQITGKDLVAGEDWGKRRRGCQRMRRLEGITDSMNMNLSKL